MDRRRVAIVIPALNEAGTIVSVVEKAYEYGLPIVVDDGSDDKTAQLARNAGAEVVRHSHNRGYDRALNSGVNRAKEVGCTYFLTMDADGQHDGAIIGAFISALDQGADVVAGVRDRRQRVAETLFAWIASAIWGLRDPLCGMKAYRMELYKEQGFFDSYGSIGTELLLYAAKKGKRIVQLQIKTKERIGTPRFGRRLSANMRIIRACWFGLIPKLAAHQ